MHVHNGSMELERRHLKLVAAIAEEGTMTRAAERLHLSQSALSHQLADLEAGLEAPIFRRVPRGMVLTAGGETLLACARTVLRELNDAEERVGAAEEQGPLRIATECYTCYHWLPPRLKEFQARYPRVDVRIAVEATRRPVEALLAHDLEVAVVSERPRQASIAARELFEDELVAILHPEHRLASLPYLRPADFAREHLLTYAVPVSDLTIFQDFLVPAGVTPAKISQMELTEAIIEMVKAGMGVSVLARWAIARHLTLKAVPLTKKGLRRNWYAATLRLRRRPKYIMDFVEALAASFE